MIKVSYTIKNEEGLHARPATDFCKTAGSFKSKICAEGEDEKEAIDALIKTLDSE